MCQWSVVMTMVVQDGDGDKVESDGGADGNLDELTWSMQDDAELADVQMAEPCA